ncbi:MAG: hypothetical protein COW30_14810 [Rhodospirillales bacterium CG15_BIG_FIL_POST_REV_8_21_14_020_66_15]|nr:MAG: hypothetical protein COW30_14810 [Rhodospirillales bacterium CG15_BIG_FIL_POST_REV_8_21_14_020_66_15]
MAKKSGSALKEAFSRPHLRRNVIVALVVGTALNAINQGDALLAGEGIDILKACLTYCVPFFVATYGAYGSLRG